MAFNGTCAEDFYPCETCDHMKYNPDHDLGLHCYMFLTKPEGVCMAHSARPRPSHEEVMKTLSQLTVPVRS